MSLQLASQPRCGALSVRSAAAQPRQQVLARQQGSAGPWPPSVTRRTFGRGSSSAASALGSGASGAGGGNGASGAGAGGQALELPGGALWWQHLHSRSTTPLYGEGFVLQRPTVGGPGLVKASRPPAPVRQPAPLPPMPPVVWHAPGSSTGLGLTLASGGLGAGSVVVDTECVVLPAQRTHARPLLPQPDGSPSAPIAPNTTCVGIVWQRSVEEEGEGDGQGEGEGEEQQSASSRLRGRRRRGSTRHPRRTQMLRFTCNLCGEVNDCEVNPHAWSKGSVFARCEGCTAVHKLKDNLRIFHELSGPVFPPRELRSAYLVQEILDRIQENNRN